MTCKPLTDYVLVIFFTTGIFLSFSEILQAQTPLRSEELQAVNNFAFALGLGSDEINSQLSTLGQYDLIVLDGEEASPEQISQLQNSGALVLGYLSVGTIEKGRGWYRKVKRHKLDLWDDWGEWYANVNSRRFRRILLKKAVKPFLEQGFDGLFLDNVDMIESHRRHKRGMKRLIKMISRSVKKEVGYLGAQNGDDSIDPFLEYLDLWNREDATSTYNFDTESYEQVSSADSLAAFETVARLLAAGLLVTTTDYVAEGNSSIQTQALSAACAAHSIPFISDIYLTRIADPPLSCTP